MKSKKELIMKSTISLLEKNGIANLTISAIAKHADIGKGTIYEYFSCKEDIFFAAFEYMLSIRIKKISKETFKNSPNYKQAINNFINSSYDILKSGIFLSLNSDSKLFPFNSHKFNEIHEMITEQFKPILEVSHKINQIGINENLVIKPTNPITHFVFINMILSTVMQVVYGTIEKSEDTNKFLYQMSLKLFN